MITTCRVTDCGTPTKGFMCKACAAELTRALVGDRSGATGLQSLMHEVSLVATRQTRVYRANGTAPQDDELSELEEEYAWRVALLPPHMRTKDGRVTLPSTPSVVNEDARELLTDAAETVTHAARLVAHLLPAGSRPDTTAAVITWLAQSVQRIRFDEHAPQIHRTIIALQKRMIHAVDRSATRLYAGPCEAHQPDGPCRRPLYAWPEPGFDNDHDRRAWREENPISCDGYRPPAYRPDTDKDRPNYRPDPYWPNDTGCGTTHSREQRREWMITDVEERLLPWSLLQDTLPGLLPELIWPHRTTWDRWQGRAAVRLKREGVNFYRGGDVIDLCVREQARIRGNRARGARQAS